MRRHSLSGTSGQGQRMTRSAAAAATAAVSLDDSVLLDMSHPQDQIEQQKSNSSNMVVAVRVRPLSSGEKEKGAVSCCNVLNNEIVAIRKEGAEGAYLRSERTTINDYAFDAAFDEKATQKEVYEGTAKPFIPNIIKGLNVTVFAYGATGAGKTHTMLGNTRADDAAAAAEAGIIPQAVFDLFSQIQQKKIEAKKEAEVLGLGGVHVHTYKVIVSFVEIYNEQVYDLLDASNKILSLREDPDKGVVVCAGCTETVVTEAKDVMSLLLQGNKRRKTEATMANAVSSRSHAVLQLNLHHTQRIEGGREMKIDSKLSLIDLAGSERASATNNRGARLQEGANINKSLLALANCINALAGNSASAANGNGKKTNVKYRDSRLTHLLKASLEGGNGNLIMIANINPMSSTFEDSHNTLKYANRAKNIKVNPSVGSAVCIESTWLERETNMRQEIFSLKARVAELELENETLRSQQHQQQNRIEVSQDQVQDDEFSTQCKKTCNQSVCDGAVCDSVDAMDVEVVLAAESVASENELDHDHVQAQQCSPIHSNASMADEEVEARAQVEEEDEDELHFDASAEIDTILAFATSDSTSTPVHIRVQPQDKFQAPPETPGPIAEDEVVFEPPVMVEVKVKPVPTAPAPAVATTATTTGAVVSSASNPFMALMSSAAKNKPKHAVTVSAPAPLPAQVSEAVKERKRTISVAGDSLTTASTSARNAAAAVVAPAITSSVAPTAALQNKRRRTINPNVHAAVTATAITTATATTTASETAKPSRRESIQPSKRKTIHLKNVEKENCNPQTATTNTSTAKDAMKVNRSLSSRINTSTSAQPTTALVPVLANASANIEASAANTTNNKRKFTGRRKSLEGSLAAVSAMLDSLEETTGMTIGSSNASKEEADHAAPMPVKTKASTATATSTGSNNNAHVWIDI